MPGRILGKIWSGLCDWNESFPSENMFCKNLAIVSLFVLLVFITGCPKKADTEKDNTPSSLAGISVRRLNYRFEADVPAPEKAGSNGKIEERNEAVQKDFDDKRLVEVLDRTIASPDKQRVLAVYRGIDDEIREFRLDMYSADGRLLGKITHDEMAVHFPDTIRWSPDSKNATFIAVVRDGKTSSGDKKEGAKPDETKKALATPSPTVEAKENVDAENSNVETNENTNSNVEAPSVEPEQVAPAPKNVLTFRTEQIYICDSNGSAVKPLTQNEGLMYFYFAWAPNSAGLVALASPFTEWRFRELQMAKTGEKFTPTGRPRLIEKNGRERLLDDFPTLVQPVWSPDSTKIAVAFNKQIRIYDSLIENPTQAAIPLRNALLLSSREYDEKLKKEEAESGEESNSNSGNSETKGKETKTPTTNTNSSNANSNVIQPKSTLPDARTLVSFNPIVGLNWELDNMLYFQTGYVKTFVYNEGENRRSYMRWHRLVLSPQAVALPRKDSE